MMAKDSVKKAEFLWQLDDGMSLTEFYLPTCYKVTTSLHLYKNNGVKLQMGGSDQWGNITTGTELICRKV